MENTNHTQDYNQAIATHYAAFRPPLHEMILRKVFSAQETFAVGLDVGCGTGCSAAALTRYCQHVIGVDPSHFMLDKALSHAMISYLHGRGEEIPLLDNSVDVITFAGSPFYIKSDALVDEMRRVCRVQARIIAYDFEIALDDIFMQLNVKPTKEKSNYDHNANFSDSVVFKAIVTGKEQVHFEVTATQLTHILLSNFQRYEAFREKYGVIDPNSSLMSELQEISTKYMLNAMTYFRNMSLILLRIESKRMRNHYSEFRQS